MALNLKALLLSRFLSALLIDTLNCWAKLWILVVVMSDTKGRESPPAKYQNIKISKYQNIWKHVG